MNKKEIDKEVLDDEEDDDEENDDDYEDDDDDYEDDDEYDDDRRNIVPLILAVMIILCIIVGTMYYFFQREIVIEVTEISFTTSEVNLSVDDSAQLSYTIYPSEATDTTVTFKSSNEEIATISNGRVIGKSEGTCSIVVTSIYGVSDIMLVVIENPVATFSELCKDWNETNYYEVAVDGTWLSVDTNPSNFASTNFLSTSQQKVALEKIEIINELLGFPSTVLVNMQHSTAMDGVSSYENDNYTVIWTYHPDRGLEVFYELKK